MMKIFFLAILAVFSASCGENVLQGNDEINSVTQEQPVVVVPEFRLSGVERIPNALVLKKMGLTISELRFAPVNTKGIAYATVDPIEVHFDLSHGELSKRHSEILLPKPGRYLVSVRLEPNSTHQSFSMEGLVEETSSTDEENDGRPQPAFDSKESTAAPEGWTFFRYESKRTVFFTLNDVEILPGKQSLAFEFDAAGWSEAVVNSISKAVRNNEFVNDGSVDVTATVESSGDDYTGLIETGVVQNQRL